MVAVPQQVHRKVNRAIYIACSVTVKFLDGLLLERPFDINYFKKSSTAVSRDRDLDFRSNQLL